MVIDTEQYEDGRYYSDADRKQDALYESYIARIATGDKDALAAFYGSAKSSVFGFALSYTRNSYEAEDILQDTFVRVFSSAGQYQPMGKPMAWVLTICKNLCLMNIREKKNTDSVSIDELDVVIKKTASHSGNTGNDGNVGNLGNAGTLFASQTDIDDRLLLTAALKKVSRAESQIVMLRAVAGLKYREIAGIMESPLSTVISSYGRAIKKLKSILEGDADNERLYSR